MYPHRWECKTKSSTVFDHGWCCKTEMYCGTKNVRFICKRVKVKNSCHRQSIAALPKPYTVIPYTNKKFLLRLRAHSHGAIFSECDCFFFYIIWNGLYGCQWYCSYCKTAIWLKNAVALRKIRTVWTDLKRYQISNLLETRKPLLSNKVLYVICLYSVLLPDKIHIYLLIYYQFNLLQRWGASLILFVSNIFVTRKHV